MEALERPQDAMSHDTYRVAWTSEDKAFVATAAEFPSLSWLAPSQFGALEGLQVLLADVVIDMKEQGEDVPEPLSERSHSGKFNLRLGEKLHREVALHAAEQNLSINQWVVRKLMADGSGLAIADGSSPLDQGATQLSLRFEAWPSARTTLLGKHASASDVLIVYLPGSRCRSAVPFWWIGDSTRVPSALVARTVYP